MAFTDRDGVSVPVPEPPPSGSRYAEIGALQGATYRRNAFVQGTAQEARVLAAVLALRPGAALLDVGCGNGRHLAELSRSHGIVGVGIDLSWEVLAGAPPGPAARVAADSATLPVRSLSVDAVMSVCQGGFGLTPERDVATVGEWYRVLRTGGRLALTAFSLVFAARYMGPEDHLDAGRGMHHHLAEVRGPDGRRRPIDLWTVAYSPRHLADLLTWHDFRVLGMAGVQSGGYRTSPEPTIADPEILIWAERR